ncbi:M20/M25/M40 family metallo-hydrolase [Candidatus Bathyarchaeota archaeon]|nr:MAG: M20/M25/M40 family metallo-hydrolase [Candidatus Bathyarchaeota archaeon]
MDTFSILKTLTEIESPSGKEAALAKHLLEYLKSLGYDAFIEDLNLLLSPEKDFIVATHLDTFKILAPFSFDGEYAYGTGVCDAKASITAILLALERIDRLNFGIALFHDEEKSGKGSEIFCKKYKPKKAVVMEPTNLTIANVHYGGLEIRIRAEGIAAHGATPEKGENAIEKCVKIITDLKRIEDVIVSVQFLSGGNEEDYMIPDRCKMRVELTFKPHLKAGGVLEEIKRICQDNVELVVKEVHNGFVSRDVVKIIERAVMGAGLKVRFSEMPSWSDAVNLHYLANCDTASFGPGELYLRHTRKERVKLRDIELAAQVLIALNSII